jgi:hypothetical protein
MSVDIGKYQAPFSLDGVPIVRKFVERSAEMKKLEQILLPNRQDHRRKMFVLHGLGGIGKTQLAIEFGRQNYSNFSAVFWLDGSSEDSLKRGIARCASTLPKDQVSEMSKEYVECGSGDIEAVVRDVLGWFAQPDNSRWLLIFDNVDREYSTHCSDPEAYDIKRYFPNADHGSILITTRLARLEQLGESQQVKKVDRKTAQATLESWYKKPCSKARPRLLS